MRAESVLAGDELFAIEPGDFIEIAHTWPRECVDFVVTSPPFPSLFSYTDEAGDIGNSEDDAEMRLHLSFFYRALARLLKPGRVAIIHVMQVPRLKRAGGQGLCDFRGINIALGHRAGLVYCYDWLVRKGPQKQAIRTRSREMQFAGLETDRANCRGALCDYLIKFVAPGENEVPVNGPEQVTRNDWIEWAEGGWNDITETDTLNVQTAKAEKDTKHICPLQFDIIERLINRYSMADDVILDPFAGLFSTAYKATELGRRSIGIELNPEYFIDGISYIKAITYKMKVPSLFDLMTAE